MNVRNRKLLDLAHFVQQCQNCGRATPDGCEPAHQNGIDAGKGFGIKGHDHRHAALCHDCHAWYDQGGSTNDPGGFYSPTHGGKLEMWRMAHLRTYDHYWAQGWVRVTP